MTRARRRLLFYTLIAVFIVIAPPLIFYSLGYTFNIFQARIEQTGGIFVKSKTPRLSLFLNNAFIKETSFFSGGALLTSVTPGTHLLRLEKQGFNPWSKTVEVEPTVVTELRHILLGPNPALIATSTPEEIALLAPLENPSLTGIAGAKNKSSDYRTDKKGNLIRQDAAGTSTPVASNVHSFNILDNTVWWVDKNGFLARLEEDGKTITTLGRPGFYLNKKPVEILKSPSGIAVILDSSGGLFLVNDEGRITPLDGGVSALRFDSKGEKMLLQKEKSIELFWLQDYSYQPFTKKGTRQVILELSTAIQGVTWYYGDDMHAVLRTREGIYMTEIDGRGGRNTVELVSGKTDELRTVPEIPNAIFFKKENTWFKVEI